MYGSSLMLVTRMLRDSRIAARDAAAIPLPRELTTPPVTKTYFAIYPARVGMEEFTGTRPPRTNSCALRAPRLARGDRHLRRIARQVYGEDAAGDGHVAHPEHAVVRFDAAAADRQPEAEARAVRGALRERL